MQDASIACGLVVHHQSLLRNKRCLLAYLNHRMQKIKALRWETGGVIPANLQRCLGPKELEFFANYDKQLGKYQQDYDLDLTQDLQPPKELHIEVRVLVDCGEIWTDSGPVHLDANTTHFLRRSDVEHLIRQGKLEQLDNES